MKTETKTLRIRGRDFEWGARTYVMGIINVSPESFAGDGLADQDAAVRQGIRFAAEAADILDVGGQSTRPGFNEIDVDEELQRVIPVIEGLIRETDLPVSIDAYRAKVAEAALDAGAHLVNDIWGFRHDEAVAAVVGERGVPAVIMHNQRGREAHDPMDDIRTGLRESIAIAERAGVPRGHLIIDPGFGFGWLSVRQRADNVARDLEILRRLGELRDFGLPILLGTSRKSSIGAILDRLDNPEERVFGTAATVALGIANGADIVRVHDLAAMVDVCRMTDAVVRGGNGGEG